MSLNYDDSGYLVHFAPVSLQLLRTFYSEGLVDSITFLTWLVQQMCTCNLAQAGFVSRLADSYLDGMLGCRGLTRPFAEACLSKLSEVVCCLR
jgi:mediator of RNA polymerase II transcription subunit 12